MLQRRKDQLTFQSSGEASSIDFIDCATNRIGQARDSQGAKIFHHGRSKPKPRSISSSRGIVPPIVAQSPTSIPYKNALNDSRLSASITRVRKKPFEDPLKKGVRTFLWKHGMFFECNTSCSTILCLFVPFTDEKWRYLGR